jgi:hypothetical protein
VRERIRKRIRQHRHHPGEIAMRRTLALTLLASLLPANAATIRYIYSTGQSLSRGRFGSPVLNTTQPFTPPNVKVWPKWNASGIDTGVFVPLISDEYKTRGGGTADVEDHGQAMANTLRQLQGGNGSSALMVDMHGVGGKCYSSLKRGASTNDSYAAGSPLVYPFDDAVGNHFGTPARDPLNSFARARTLATAQGDTLVPLAMTVVHGECDFTSNVTAATYEGYLVEWLSNFNQEASYVAGSPVSVPMFTSQFSSWGGQGSTQPVTSSGVDSTPIGQWMAARDNPNTIGLVTPHYFLQHHTDYLHLVNTSYERLGGYFAKALNKWVTQGKIWRPVAPRSITYSGSTINARFHVPVAPLVFDTTAVTDPGDKGFEVWRGTTRLTLSSVTLGSADTVQIVVSQPLDGTERLRYAYTTCSTSTCTGPTNGARGNLRDSDTTTLQRVATQLPNWAITFNESINGFTWEPDAQVQQTMTAAPSTLGFSYTTGGTLPGAQAIAASVSSGTAAYTASSNAAWLSVSPASGTLSPTTSSLTVSVSPTGLAAGTYTGTITTSATGVSNSPLTTTVTLTISNPVVLSSAQSTRLTGTSTLTGKVTIR